jgi:hypothetical protein
MAKEKEIRVGLYRSRQSEKLTSRIRHLHNSQLIPYDKGVRVLENLPGGGIKGRLATHVTIGDFYEAVSRSLYGGVLLNRDHVGVDNGQMDLGLEGLAETSNDSELPPGSLVKPDLVLAGNFRAESKAWRTGQRCHLIDPQIFRYIEIQRKYPDQDILFMFYRHTFGGIKKNKDEKNESPMSELDVHMALSRGTCYSMVLPLSMILKLHGKWFGRKIRDRLAYEFPGAESYPPCTMARGRLFDQVMTKPRVTLKELSLKSRDYNISRAISPENLELVAAGERVPVAQFPIIAMRDANRDWMGRLEAIYQRAHQDLERHREKWSAAIEMKQFLLAERLKRSEEDSDPPDWVVEDLDELLGRERAAENYDFEDDELPF